jgi:septum formation protein
VKLILASASPRRAALLREAGYEFQVHPAHLDEDRYLDKFLPRQLAGFLATAKAWEIARQFPDDVTLAADTVIAFGDLALGKPADEAAAREMIGLLGGATHLVITGIAVHCPARKIELGAAAMSAVRMRVLAPAELDEYVSSDRWRGKAGGYGIQDADPIVTCIGGSVSNVIGLPMTQTRELLQQAGIPANTTPDNNDKCGQGGGPSV